MGILKEFIKENSPDQPPKKKKKRVRFKNLNPFRKRKYQTLDEHHKESDGKTEQNPHLADSRESSNTQSSDNRTHKPRGAKEILYEAWGSLGLSKGSTGHTRGGTKRNTPRRHGGSTACLIEDGLTTTDDKDVNIDHKLSKSGQNTKECQTSGSEVKPGISDEIEVIETAADEVPPKKKKKNKRKSAKKRVKKAGLKTAKMLGHGLSNVAVSFQFVSPDAAVSAVVKDMAKARQDRYRDMMYAAAAAT